MEYIRNIQGISIDIYDQKHRPNGAAAEGGACVSDYFISSIFMDIPYMFLIYSIYIFPRYVPLSSMYKK